jgi:hypothetical protein
MAEGTHGCQDRRRVPVAPGFLALLPFLVACGESDHASTLQDLPLAAVEAQVRIGSVDDPDFAFSRVSALEVAPDGAILSLHGQESQIRRWTPDGRSAGSVGRRGQGPGEFSRPSSMGWKGDTLWVMDLDGYRFSYFDSEGSFLGGLTPRVDLGSAELARDGVYPPRPAGLLRDGTVWSQTPAWSQQVVEGTLNRVFHVRTDPAGGVLDTLLVQPVGTNGTLGILYPQGGGVFTRQPFGDGVMVQPLPDLSGLLVVERPAPAEPGSAEFRVIRVDASGDTVFARAYPYTPTAISRSRVDSIVEAQAESLHGFVGERTGIPLGEWRRRVAEALYTPTHHPPVAEAVPGRDGSLWLRLAPSGPEGPEWLVLDTNGEPLRRVRVPERTRILTAETDRFWGVTQDDLDVGYIVRFRVVEPAGG